MNRALLAVLVFQLHVGIVVERYDADDDHMYNCTFPGIVFW